MIGGIVRGAVYDASISSGRQTKENAEKKKEDGIRRVLLTPVGQ